MQEVFKRDEEHCIKEARNPALERSGARIQINRR